MAHNKIFRVWTVGLAILLNGFLDIPAFAKSANTENQQPIQASPQQASNQASNQDSSETHAGKAASIDILAEKLSQRLKNNPDDASGWALLAKSYQYLGRIDEANRALSEAKSRGYTGELTAVKPRKNPHESLHIRTNRNDWLTKYINEKIVQQDSAPDNPAQTTGSIAVELSIPETLKNSLPDSTIVYIFAKEREQRGPPLAVKKFTLANVPAYLTLTDKDAIIAGRSISSGHNIVAGARISISGNPNRQPGDYETHSKPVTKDSPHPVTLNLTASHLIKENQP